MQLAGVLADIRKCGLATGLVLNPATPAEAVLAPAAAGLLDVVVVMLVSPGWGGPKNVALGAAKVAKVKQLCLDNGIPVPLLEVDGGVDAAGAPELLAAGADILVAGGSVFKAEDKREAIDTLLSG